jgi:TIR domain
MESPKLFISYSWSNPDHEAWVLQLATELRESGVDVILDKWDLKEGHDANAFMEKMVSDPSIQKVALICDKMYAEKTDGRRGGLEQKPRSFPQKFTRSRFRTSLLLSYENAIHKGKRISPHITNHASTLI